MQRITKFILSFFKSDWQLADYPVRLRNLSALPSTERDLNLDFPAELEPLLRWSADIEGWDRMSAFGDTSEEAFANLVCKFNTYKAGPVPLPRPGKKVDQGNDDLPEIEAYEIIAVDFFSNILETNFYTCVLSDQASLWDFLPGDDYKQRITNRYGIDISDIRSGNLVKIFRRIYDRYRT